MNKPVNLMDIQFSDKTGNIVLREEYNTMFDSYEKAELYIQSRRSYWEELYHMRLEVMPRQNETIKEIEIQKVFKLTAKYMGLDPRYIFRKTRSAEIIEVRRTAIAICLDYGLSVSIIAKAINLDHSTVVHHKGKFYDLCKYESGYEDKYIHVKDSVLTNMNGRFKEEGSGQKINNNEPG